MPQTFTLKAADLAPGTCRAFAVGGRTVMVYHLDGQFYATQGLCSHEDQPLAGGRFTQNVIECPHHGSRFNVRTGKVLTPPAAENLRTYPVTVQGETVTVMVS
mgnify:CR=1 FL=1